MTVTPGQHWPKISFALYVKDHHLFKAGIFTCRQRLERLAARGSHSTQNDLKVIPFFLTTDSLFPSMCSKRQERHSKWHNYHVSEYQLHAVDVFFPSHFLVPFCLIFSYCTDSKGKRYLIFYNSGTVLPAKFEFEICYFLSLTHFWSYYMCEFDAPGTQVQMAYTGVNVITKKLCVAI